MRACPGLFGPSLLELRAGQVRGEFAAAEEDRRRAAVVPVRERDGVAGDLSWGVFAEPFADQQALTAKPRKKILQAAGAGRTGTDLLPQNLPVRRGRAGQPGSSAASGGLVVLSLLGPSHRRCSGPVRRARGT